MKDYVPSVEAFNAIIHNSQREELLLEIQSGLRKRSLGFAFGGHNVKYHFDDALAIAYVDVYVDQYNAGADEWVCAFDAVLAEETLDKSVADARAWAENEGLQFGEAQLFHAYKNAANQLLETLPLSQIPKSMRARVKSRRESYE